MSKSQRDVFIEEIYKSLEKNNKIFFLSADFGAPALDALREKYPENFIHCGISEQAMIDIATGLALEGNIVFCYAMAPFLSLRSLEQIKCGPGLMALPICMISVGVGLGYADAGPTHYTTEDLACLRSIPRTSVYTASDTYVTEYIVNNYLKKPHFSYVRLDRDILPNLFDINNQNLELGFRTYGKLNSNSICLISHGRMSHLCKEATIKHPDNFYLIDIIKNKPFPKEIINVIKNSSGFITVDEQSPGGSLFSIVHEALAENNFTKPSSFLCLPDDYVFENGGRNYLLNKLGFNVDTILKHAKKINQMKLK